jgi:hypothetical protein
MKKQLWFLAILVMSSFVFHSCNNKGGSGDTYTLKMRLAPGDKFKQQMDVEMESKIEAMGQKMNTIINMNSLVAFEVHSDSGNLKVLKMTYEDMKMTMKSDNPQASGPEMDSILRKSMEPIKGKSASIVINEKNEVVEVRGFDSLMMQDDMSEITRAQMERLFSKDQMNKTFGMMFQMYPDKPVKVGETWVKQLEVEVASAKIKMDVEYKLASVKDGVAHLDMNGKISGKGSFNEAGTQGVEVDMKGNQDGKISIGLEDGYVKDGDYKMDVDAAMEMMGQKMPIKLKAKYLIQGK